MTTKPPMARALLLGALVSCGLSGCDLDTGAGPVLAVNGTFQVSTAAQLRAALEQAAHDREDSTISLAAGSYAANGTPFTYAPDKDEKFALRILGAGRATTTLDGGGTSSVLQIVLVEKLLDDAAAAVTVSDLTIRDGHSTEQVGAGLYVASSDAPITIERVGFVHNKTESAAGDALGGGLYVVTARGAVTVRDGVFDANQVEAVAGQANGAGLAAFASGGAITLSGNHFTGNQGQGFFASRGVGAFLVSDGAGPIAVRRSEFNGNESEASSGLAAGAGLEARSLNAGTIEIAENVIAQNSATGLVAANGAGVAASVAAGNLSLLRNTIRGNTATSESGSAFGGGAHVLSTTAGPIRLDGNQFDGNHARGLSALGVRGGAASVESDQQGKIVLTNNVASNNDATSELGFATAGGIFAGSFFDADLDVTHNTFFHNSTTGSGGGLVITGASVLNVFGNLLFQNAAESEAPDLLALDARTGALGTVVRLVRNLLSTAVLSCEQTAGCTPRVTREENLASDPRFVDAAAGDFRLLPGSPAIDAGTASAPSLPASDVAGNVRTLGAAPDLGAFETGCGADVSARLAITPGGFRLNRATRRFVQVVTIANAGTQAVPGPLSLVVGDVSRTVSLANATGATACAAPVGRGVVGVNLGAGESLAPGASATLVLEFANPNGLPIHYDAHVLTGAF